MKAFKLIIIVLLSCCVACSDKTDFEHDIPLAPPYPLPERGISEVGDRIVDLFENYSTFLLYDYTIEDFRWATVTESNVYQLTLGDEQYLGKMLDFVDDIFFNFYPEEFKKHKLPFKIFLASEIYVKPADAIKDLPFARNGYYKALKRDNAIAISGMNSQLDNMDPVMKRDYKGEVNKAFITYLLARGKLEIPEEFYTVSDYSKRATKVTSNYLEDSPDSPRMRGFLPLLDQEDPYTGTFTSQQVVIDDWASGVGDFGKEVDIKSFLQNMVAHGDDYPEFDYPYPYDPRWIGTNVPFTDRFTWNYYLSKDADGNYRFPLIKKKYDILQNFFKERYGLDLAAIGKKIYE